MSFVPSQATEVCDISSMRAYSRALRSKGKRLVLVGLSGGFHAGHAALIRAAKRIPGALVVVAAQPGVKQAELAAEKVDLVFRYTDELLWPTGRRLGVTTTRIRLEPAAVLETELSLVLALLGAVAPTDLIVGEKDYELALMINRMVADFHLDVQVHSHPTVRTPDGLALSLSNAAIAVDQREQAVAMAAALVAGAHAAEGGTRAVLEAASSVLTAAGVEPEYLELRSLTLDEAPTEGDARLLIAVNFGGIRLIDNVGVPVGIGFKNLEPEL